MMKDPAVLYIIVPCYNEEKVLSVTGVVFTGKLRELIEAGEVSEKSRVLFVNDGSTDNTWEMIKEISGDDILAEGISLSRNRGHQNALWAGLMEAKDLCDITVSIDCDGQDDINAVDEMVKAYYEGNDIVYGVRSDRKSDSSFKRASAELFYKIMTAMGVETVHNHADFRLLSKRVLEELGNYREVNLFLRGMVTQVGFKSACVYYKRKRRITGDSHYSLPKMVRLATDGITGMSVKPVQFIGFFGLGLFAVDIIGIIILIILGITGHPAAFWVIYLFITMFMGSIILTALGVVGIYVGKTYMEVKDRPRYIISEKTF